MDQKNPKSTLLVDDNTRVDNNKTNQYGYYLWGGGGGGYIINRASLSGSKD